MGEPVFHLTTVFASKDLLGKDVKQVRFHSSVARHDVLVIRVVFVTFLAYLGPCLKRQTSLTLRSCLYPDI